MEHRWFEQWKEFVQTGDQNSSSFPGQIDNTELFEGQFTLSVCRSRFPRDRVRLSLIGDDYINTIMVRMSPGCRSGLVSPKGASGGERGVCVGPG